jgi:tRNA 2-thiouridine synthesizing protein D
MTSFALLITAAPLDLASETAFQFSLAALKKGYTIKCIFFYQNGVYHGNRLIYLENPALINRWQKLSHTYHFELTLCSASAARRGIMDEAQAQYFEKDGSNLAEGFQIAGLSVWFESMSSADRVMVFGEMD